MDVWAVGIMGINMAHLEYPYWSLPPAEAREIIKIGGSPQLNEPKLWSDDFVDFLKCCLDINPDGRWTIEKLLNHSFITNHLIMGPSKDLLNMLKEHELKVNHAKTKKEDKLQCSVLVRPPVQIGKQETIGK